MAGQLCSQHSFQQRIAYLREEPVILDSADQAGMAQVAARLRSAISSLRFDNHLRVSVSLGVAQHRPGQVRPDLQELLRQADADLRAVKSSRSARPQNRQTLNR